LFDIIKKHAGGDLQMPCVQGEAAIAAMVSETQPSQRGQQLASDTVAEPCAHQGTS
jgi:hypothetical protein